MKILVIEDHPSELKLAHQVLSAAGHEVTDAEAAEQAFAAINQERPHIILLDMSLPGMDGLALVRMLKADRSTSEIPIVAVTSFPERYSRSEALAAGCNAYILKPISTRGLPQQLDDLVATQSGRSD
jgi:CheY-like chemotaxis protein